MSVQRRVFRRTEPEHSLRVDIKPATPSDRASSRPVAHPPVGTGVAGSPGDPSFR